MLKPKRRVMGAGQEYWDDRYTAGKGEPLFDWYADFESVRMVIEPYIDEEQKGDTILVLGCGNSQLSMHLRDAGYGHITSVDISEVCVSQARAKYGADGSQQLSFEVADVRDMRALFSDASFDLVVDKATLDGETQCCPSGSPHHSRPPRGPSHYCTIV